MIISERPLADTPVNNYVRNGVESDFTMKQNEVYGVGEGRGEGGLGEARVASEEAGVYEDVEEVLIDGGRAASRDFEMNHNVVYGIAV